MRALAHVAHHETWCCWILSTRRCPVAVVTAVLLFRRNSSLFCRCAVKYCEKYLRFYGSLLGWFPTLSCLRMFWSRGNTRPIASCVTFVRVNTCACASPHITMAYTFKFLQIWTKTIEESENNDMAHLAIFLCEVRFFVDELKISFFFLFSFSVFHFCFQSETPVIHGFGVTLWE